MIINTTVSDNGGSVYVRIPKAMAEHFELIEKDKPFECKIEDLNKYEARLIFR